MSSSNGFTLLEALVSLSFISIVFFVGYTAFLNQEQLFSQILPRTRSEEESNYRFWTLTREIRESSTGLKSHPLLEQIPLFFPDLKFGEAPTADAFSVASVAGTPVPFRKNGTWYEIPAGTAIQVQNICLVSGADEVGSYSWNFVRISEAESGSILDRLRWESLLKKPSPEHGTIIRVDMNGVRFRDGTLYLVNANGSLFPFFDGISEFSYSWNAPLLTIRWTAGPVHLECEVCI